jgi:lipopolysaccharide transport system permease protein
MELTTSLPAQGLPGPAPEPAAGLAPTRLPLLTIRAGTGWKAINLTELWAFRDLLFTLAGRDLRLRYKQTVLGVAWVVIQPLMAAGIFSFVFGRVARMPSDGVPYFIFSYAGLMGWNLFSGTLTKVSGSLVGNSHLISKVFFPRLILPLSSVPSSLVDFGVTAIMMLGLMALHGVGLSWGLLLLPVWTAMLLALATGIGLWTTSLMVSYRDVGYVVPVALQMLLYASPVAYAVSAVPESLRAWFQLNPLVPVLEAFRWSLLGSGQLNWPALGWAGGAISVVFVLGLFSFKRMERQFADVI